MCDTGIPADNITTCGFARCRWIVKGRRKEDSEAVTREGTASDAYFMFEDEGLNDRTEWAYLQITCL